MGRYVISNCRKIVGGSKYKKRQIRSGQNVTIHINDSIFNENYNIYDYLEQCKNYYEIDFDGWELSRLSTIKKKDHLLRHERKLIREVNNKMGNKFHLDKKQLLEVILSKFKINMEYKCLENLLGFKRNINFKILTFSNYRIELEYFNNGLISKKYIDVFRFYLNFDEKSRHERRTEILENILSD